MYRSWKCTFSAITPCSQDLSLSNGFTVTNVPSVRHLRAIIMIHYCMRNLRYGMNRCPLFPPQTHCSIAGDTPTQQSINKGQELHVSKMVEMEQTADGGKGTLTLKFKYFICQYILSPTIITTNMYLHTKRKHCISLLNWLTRLMSSSFIETVASWLRQALTCFSSQKHCFHWAWSHDKERQSSANQAEI